jgi:hypothetical protein
MVAGLDQLQKAFDLLSTVASRLGFRVETTV